MTPIFNQSPVGWIDLASPPPVQLGRAIASAIRRFAAELRYRRAIQELHQLDARMLSDIGLVHSEIEAAVRGGRRGTAVLRNLPTANKRRSQAVHTPCAPLAT